MGVGTPLTAATRVEWAAGLGDTKKVLRSVGGSVSIPFMGTSDVFQHLSRLSKGEVLAALRDLERDRAELNSREAALRAVLPYASGDEGEDSAPARGPMPLWRSILAVMAAQPGKRWTTAELLQGLLDIDAAPKGLNPKNQITNRLADLRERGDVLRNEDGTHILASDAEAQKDGK